MDAFDYALDEYWYGPSAAVRREWYPDISSGYPEILINREDGKYIPRLIHSTAVNREVGYCFNLIPNKDTVNCVYQFGETFLVTQHLAGQCPWKLLPNQVVCDGCKEMTGLKEVDGQMMCPDCEKEYRTEHPDPAEESAKAEWYQDTRGDR